MTRRNHIHLNASPGLNPFFLTRYGKLTNHVSDSWKANYNRWFL